MSLKKSIFALMLVLIAALVLVACAPAAAPADEAPADEAPADEAPADESPSAMDSEAAIVADEFFSQERYEESIVEMSMEPSGPEGEPWLQVLGEPEMVDTSMYAKDGPYTICFSNAGVNNPWRVVGYTTMLAEVDLHEDVAEFIHVDAEGSDEKQIADIADLVAGGNCDALIVSPNTTAALTPAVEQACEALPVVVFDRGVFTDCPVSFVQPIGGYAFGR